MIPYGRQDIDEADIAAVVEVLRSDFITQGPVIPRFEAAVAARCRAKHAVAVSSGTAALHLACLALGLGPGDRLWTSPISFVASANCGLYCGAEVDFVDIDPITRTMSVPALADKLAAAERDGRLPAVVVPVHFAGLSSGMPGIASLARRYGFKVLEDACHALGGSHDGEPVGSCRWSEASVFSYHPVKGVTTGEGGMVMTNDAGLAERVARLRTHGITRDPAALTEPGHGAWHYEQTTLGFNCRLTDLQAALGLSQLGRLDGWVRRRGDLATLYDEAFRPLPLGLPTRVAGTASAWHLYVVELDEAAAGRSRRAVFDGLRTAGIGVNVHYIPIHTQPYYRGLGFRPGQFPAAERYYAGAITLPLFPGLSEMDQGHVIRSLQALLGG